MEPKSSKKSEKIGVDKSEPRKKVKTPSKTLVVEPPKQRPQEPGTPPRMDVDGLNKLIRVSHLTTLAKELSEKNQPSYLLDMPRVRDLNLDVNEDELPMLKELLKKENVFEFEETAKEILGQEKLPTLEPLLCAPFGEKMVPHKFQRPLNSPRLSDVNLDAPVRMKNKREKSNSLENSPVIQSKKPKRASLSQEPSSLRGKRNCYV